MKAIILAGGSGTRLYPATFSISKQLIPIYDKPMIYYPLSILMLVGIKEILIISSPDCIHLYQKLFQNGEQFGMKISYQKQINPRGLADAFILGEKFIAKESICLALGDNIFYGGNLIVKMKKAVKLKTGGVIFAYHVKNPREYGVVEFDSDGKVISIEEKPKNPKSNFAVPGLYFYDKQITEIAKKIQPSKRGEIEISSINQIYLKKKNLTVEELGRGTAWLDTGTPENLHEASNFIATIEKRQGFKIACLEEIAFHSGWISKKKLLEEAKKYKGNQYGNYLEFVANNTK